MERSAFPQALIEILIDIGKREEEIKSRMALAVRQQDREAVFKLAAELTGQQVDACLPQPRRSKS